jgi:hypothetical protein
MGLLWEAGPAYRGHFLEETNRMLNSRAQAAGTPYHTKVAKRMLADGELDELWGPVRRGCGPR